MNDDQLRRLLTDAVSDIEPEDRIEELRATVRPAARVVRHFHARPWYAAAGIVAAVICLVAFITSVAGTDSAGPGFAHGGSSGSSQIVATDTAAPTPTPSADGGRSYPVYYIGRNRKHEPVLFREFHRGGSSRPAGALAVEGLESTPLDPDYSSPWRSGALRSAKEDPKAGVIVVTLGYSSLQHRPADMGAAYARAAVQQVVYTVQAALKSRFPVQFVLHATPARDVLGVPATKPIAPGKVVDTLSLVSISGPNQGDAVSGDKLRVTGVNSGFEGTVVVHLERNGQQFATAPTTGGGYPDKLTPWAVTLDLLHVAPGTYTLVAENDDPAGRHDPDKDTRVITVE